MARIAGVEIPNNKRIEAGLRAIYGIGLSSSREILRKAGVNIDTRVKDLSEVEINQLRNIIEKEYRVEGDLRREISMDIKRLIDIKSYRGMRHVRSLPVRGQRSRTNARTRKGPKKTIGVSRAKSKTMIKEEKK